MFGKFANDLSERISRIENELVSTTLLGSGCDLFRDAAAEMETEVELHGSTPELADFKVKLQTAAEKLGHVATLATARQAELLALAGE